MGAANAALFKSTAVRLVGRGYDARLANVNQAILRYHGTYIAVTASWMPTRGAWRAVLARITRQKRRVIRSMDRASDAGVPLALR